jgi:hypothetical protein
MLSDAMPSDAKPPVRLAWLRSQGLGLICGQLTVLLLGTGSVVIAATRDGASAAIQMDDLRPFFEEPSLVHAWFYALLFVIALYALNTLLCTWDSVRSRLARGTRELSAWAPTVIHVSWLIALLSHLVGGLGNTELEPVVLSTAGWTTVEPGLSLRLLRVASELTPSGKVKQTRATVEAKDAQGHVVTDSIAYNEPYSRGVGAELLLLSQVGRVPGVASFTLGTQRCQVVVPGTCALGVTTLEVVALQQAEHLGNRLVAVVHEGTRSFPMVQGGSRAVDGGELRFDGASEEDVVQLRHRHAPGNPVAFVSAVLLACGLLLMGRRWLKPVAE